MEQKPLLTQRLSAWAASALRENRLPLASTFLFALLAYTFAFTNKLPNHDDVSQLFAKGATVSSGRFGLAVLDTILPNYSMPWIYGILTIALIAVAICIVLKLFCIQTKLIQVLLCGCIIVFPSLIGLFGYMFTSSAYAIAILLIAVSLWCVRKHRPFFFLLGAGFLTASLSIYQAYLSIAASLLVLLLIFDLLQGADAITVFKRGVSYVAFLLLALALYYAANKFCMALKGESYNSYAAGAMHFELSRIPWGIREAYVNFFLYFSRQQMGLVSTSFSQAAHFLLLACCLGLAVLWVKKQRKGDLPRVLLLLALTALLPLAINCMFIVIDPSSIHTLVMYSFASLYVFAAIFWEALFPAGEHKKMAESLRRLCLNGAAIALALILAVNTYVANMAYLNMHLRYENSYAFFTALLADLQQIPQFQAGSRLAILGHPAQRQYYEDHFLNLAELEGIQGFSPDDYSNGYFLRYYMGLSIPMATEEEKSAIAATEEFAAMSCYPYSGSIQAFDDIIVVKLSENP